MNGRRKTLFKDYGRHLLTSNKSRSGNRRYTTLNKDCALPIKNSIADQTTLSKLQACTPPPPLRAMELTVGEQTDDGVGGSREMRRRRLHRHDAIQRYAAVERGSQARTHQHDVHLKQRGTTLLMLIRCILRVLNDSCCTCVICAHMSVFCEHPCVSCSDFETFFFFLSFGGWDGRVTLFCHKLASLLIWSKEFELQCNLRLMFRVRR